MHGHSFLKRNSRKIIVLEIELKDLHPCCRLKKNEHLTAENLGSMERFTTWYVSLEIQSDMIRDFSYKSIACEINVMENVRWSTLCLYNLRI